MSSVRGWEPRAGAGRRLKHEPVSIRAMKLSGNPGLHCRALLGSGEAQQCGTSWSLKLTGCVLAAYES